VKGAGFGADTNVVTIITADQEKELPLMEKEQVAGCILDELLGLRENKGCSNF
jgi:phosphopantothenoylcysteine decarboxylase/phosphopantothenate--cysteine ligase